MDNHEGLLTVSIDGRTALVSIEREAKLNALDAGMVAMLADICRALDRDVSVDVVIITGAGDKAFSAGGDIEDWGARTPLDFARFWLRDGHDAFDSLARLRQPVIAVLNGHALGGGLELAAACDLVIAERHAKLGQPEAGIGIIPGWSGTQRAVRRFGARAVRRMALFGEVFDAATAHALGIVDEVVESGAGMARAMEVAQRIRQRAPVATEITKMLINAAEGEERERVLEALGGALARGMPDIEEGIAAFREKRRPVFERR